MEIREIISKEELENFLVKVKDKTFLQSWNWGVFQEEMGNKIWRFGLFDKELISSCLVIKINAKRGTFFLIQHGPVVGESFSKKESLSFFISKLKEIAIKEKVSFIRMNPLWVRNKENENIFIELNCNKSPIQENSYESTVKLDIKDEEDILFKNMRKTTRYVIKKAINNKDISVIKSSDINLIKEYQKLNKKVAKRQRFIPFSDQFIKKEFEVFSKDNESLLFIGKYKEEIAAGALVIFWNNSAFYHQAATDERFMKLSIPYLLQWEAIKEAKNRGCSLYDFWGYIDPKKYPHHPWAGPTLFKLGYNGIPYEYTKTYDYPISIKYWAVYLFEVLRKLRRRI